MAKSREVLMVWGKTLPCREGQGLSSMGIQAHPPDPRPSTLINLLPGDSLWGNKYLTPRSDPELAPSGPEKEVSLQYEK